ncbi:MAG: CotH kinase family protein [Xanthomonadales bacterium]|nr:CotH kinase family protein [Xanthomonadales bacterium]
MKLISLGLIASAVLSFSHHALALGPEAASATSHRAQAASGQALSGDRPYRRALHELVHERTAHSRTLQNDDRTRTVVMSSVPLHYQDEHGNWLGIDQQLTDLGNRLVFPSHGPGLVYDKHDGSIELAGADGQAVTQSGRSRLLQVGPSSQVIARFERAQRPAQRLDGNTLTYEDGFSGIDIERQFQHGGLTNTYVLRNANLLSATIDQLVFEEDLALPAGYSLRHAPGTAESGNGIQVLDAQGQLAFIIEPPLATDAQPVEAKTRHLYAPHQAGLSFQDNGDSNYTVRVALAADWLQRAGRTLPVTVRSTITVVSNAVIASCHTPAFQQSTLVVDVPEGDTILWTDIEYDFVSINQAWRSEQRSFVSGPAGQTPVFSGTGDTTGTQTYALPLSEIGNGVSTGTVPYVFHSARTWGGSGCNSSFSFLNRRQLSVTYGTVEFGDGPVSINEYSASNRTFLDGFGRTEDWIELRNADPERFFDLSGYHLSNDASAPTKWRISNGIIPPGGHVIVFASERDLSSGMVQHASFDLTQLRPDQIVLADPDGVILESHTMHVTQVNHSYGRIHDGADQWGVFTSPSPGNANANARVTYASRPTLSVAAGAYQGSVTLAMASAGNNEQIRYTTNGATPTASSSLYTAPIMLNQTAVVRARAFSTDADILPSFIETRTYLIDETFTLPVFSFSGDQDLLSLFGGNQNLEPLGHFEYFEADGQFVDGNFGDFNKHGNDSWSYPQRGVDFVSRDDYGYKRRLEHRFFETSDRTRFRRLMVKAAANDNYPFQNGGAHIRDSYIQHLSQLAGLDLDERSSSHVLLFVNGQYWGVYDLRERVDDNNYTDYYYGQDYTYRESDVHLQFLKTWQGTTAHFGNQPALNDWASLRQYVQNNNMGDPQHYAYVQGQLNIDSLIDYFVINSWVVSRDWLNYNTGWWRGLNPAGSAQQWRYILWDLEAALGHFHNYTNLPNPTHTAPPCQAEALPVGNGHTQILSKLIQQNPEVRRRYVTRYIDLLNTHFSATNAVAVLDGMIDTIAPEMPRQIARWGGNLTTWQNNVAAVRNFVNNRYTYLMNTGLASCYGVTGPFATQFDVVPADGGRIRMNSEWLPDYPFQARLFGNITTRALAEPAPGHTFSHWEIDGVAVLPVLTDPQIEVLISQASSVTAHFTPPVSGGELIHYWHFNDLVTPNDVTSIAADHSLIAGAPPLMTYTGSGPRDIDAYNEGSELNLHLGQPPGRSARVRNPSAGRSLVFDLPTTGYGQINFSYAVERTNNGMLRNLLSYSIDGVNFIQSGLDPVEFPLDSAETYYLVNLDFAAIAGASDNPDFKVRIAFDGNTTGTSGNNRIDNVSLNGVRIDGAPATRLGFGAINGDSPVHVGEPFFATVQALDDLGNPAPVTQDTEVSLALVAGAGTLSGTLAGILPAGSHTVVIDGIVYSQVDQDVRLGATASGLAPATSAPFSVLRRSFALVLGQNVQGAGTVDGGGMYFEGDPVTLTASPADGFVFEGWIDTTGQVASTQAQWSFAMPAAALHYTARYALTDNGALIHYWHFNDLAAGDLELVPSDFSAVASGLITYPGIASATPNGIMDRRSHNSANPVSNFNLRLDQPPDDGHVLRVRNPSHAHMLRVQAPSTGYQDLVVSFATTRTSNGASEQAFQFSSDAGLTWMDVGEAYAVSMLDETGYLARTFHLSAFDAVNDNPDLVFRILFTGDGASNLDGNNRFDNLSIEGTSVFKIFDRIYANGFEVQAGVDGGTAVDPGGAGMLDGAVGDPWDTGVAPGAGDPHADHPMSGSPAHASGDEDPACRPIGHPGSANTLPCRNASATPEGEVRGTQPAAVPVPVMRPAALALMGLLLLLAGLYGFRVQASRRVPAGRAWRSSCAAAPAARERSESALT